MKPLEPKARLSIRLEVNGRPVEGEVEARRSLADFLREDLRLTGTHLGCEHGVCGACTVLLNGEPVRSCLFLAAQADGVTVETVEGLALSGKLHPLQEAFWNHHALQCGFCTPGFLMTLKAYLRDHPSPSRQALREALSGNICRCTGYQHILLAAEEAARRLRGGA
jgi:carbon-monoxide dehydrogenase small subunit